MRALIVLQATVERQKAQLEVTVPKADALDRIATANGGIMASEAAKAFQMSPSALFEWLQDHKWYSRRNHRSARLGREPQLVRGKAQYSHDLSIKNHIHPTACL